VIPFPRIEAKSRLATTFVVTILSIFLSAATSLSAYATETRTSIERAQFAYWNGRSCTTPACQQSRPGTFADAASFGLAALAGVWYSRRRRPPPG
jgi:MYXO-CTERM domain-containing protein